jgi:hypothetical protein
MIWIAGLVCANWCYSCKSRLDAYLLARAVAREPFEREAADRIKREAAKFQLELEAERRRLAKEREAMENFFEQKLDAAHRETQEEVARRKATEEEAIAQTNSAERAARLTIPPPNAIVGGTLVQCQSEPSFRLI